MKKRINSLFALRTIRLMASSILAAMFLLVLPVAIHAQQAENTNVISYQGSVTTNNGSEVTGDHQITATLYSDAGGTQSVWSGTYKQKVTGGVFSVLLGSGAYPLPPAQDFSKTLWVGIKIDGGEELKPLTQLTGAPYSVSIADQSVTKDKIAVDYVGSVMVNGKRITGKGTTLNLVDGLNTSLLYDESTNSLSLNSIGGIDNPSTQAGGVDWQTGGNALAANGTFGQDNAFDVIMESGGVEQMRMIGTPVGPTITGGLLLPTSLATGVGVIFQNSTAHTYIHSFGAITNFFAGNDAGNLSMGVGATNNTGVGDSALFANTSGSTNTACGSAALKANTSGYDNTASGYWALWKSTTGYQNTAIGACALEFNTTGITNSAMGWGALNQNTTGHYNTACGADALHFNTTGYNNSACGISALYSNTTGYYNSGFGTSALYNNTTASYNTASGMFALYSNNGNDNTANGYQTLYSNTTGFANTASGMLALFSNIDGYGNTAYGDQALYENTSGLYNTAIGINALETNQIGGDNTAVGVNSGWLNTTGDNNTFVGEYSGPTNTTGSNNTFIGSRADASGASLTNATAIGNGALVDASNTIELGDANVTAVSTYGHIVTQSSIGGVAGDGAVITTASISATGSDVAGSVTFSTTAVTGAGTATISYATYGSAPTVVLFPANAAATNAALGGVFVTSTATTFTINVTDPGTAVASAKFNYIVIK